MRQIESKTGVGKSTIGRIKKGVECDKENLKGGHPSKLSATAKRAISRQITSGKLDNAVQATHYINSTYPTSVSTQTVRRALVEEDMVPVVKKKRPLLTKRQRKLRLEFALKHREWTVEDWKKVLWSDETKINRIGSDGRSYVWKKKGEPLSTRLTTPTVKHGGGNLMVWGCMGWEGVGMVVEVQGRMNAQQFCEILETGLAESFEKLGMEGGESYFQQDLDPKHTSNKATKWFEDHAVTLLDWCPQSPDINPIEHLWVHLKNKLSQYETSPKGVHELWDRLVVEWNKIPPEVCQNLISSLPRRLEAVIKAKGGSTKY